MLLGRPFWVGSLEIISFSHRHRKQINQHGRPRALFRFLFCKLDEFGKGSCDVVDVLWLHAPAALLLPTPGLLVPDPPVGKPFVDQRLTE